VSERQGELDVLLDEEHRDAFLVNAPDHGTDLLHDPGRQTENGLVDHEQRAAGP